MLLLKAGVLVCISGANEIKPLQKNSRLLCVNSHPTPPHPTEAHDFHMHFDKKNSRWRINTLLCVIA